MSSVLDILRSAVPDAELPGADFSAWRTPTRPIEQQAAWDYAGRPPVQDSKDFRRIRDLARRPQVDLSASSEMAHALVQIMGERLRRPDWQRTNCKCASYGRKCIKALLPAQAWALYEAPLARGLLGSIAAGSGKTSLNILLAMVMPCKSAVLLVPSNLVKQLMAEWELWREHWRVPSYTYGGHEGKFVEGRPVVHIVPYSQLSRPESTRLLKERNPDLILADEMHKLSARDSARTSRFLRFFAENKGARFCGYTGTITNKSVIEYAHLSFLALRELSPVPLDPREAAAWALALDPIDRRAQPGVLSYFCAPGDEVEDGFRKRLVESLGVVATREGAVTASLNIYEYPAPAIPQVIMDNLKMVRSGWRPDGEELVDPLEVAKNAREVAAGFYYKWKFLHLPRKPDGKLTEESVQRIDLWFARRKAWLRELRDMLRERAEHLDSPKLCTEAAKRGALGNYVGDLPVWQSQAWGPWLEVRDTIEHELEAVWLDDFWLLECAAWAKKHRGIVWYEHDAFGQKLGQMTGLPVHGGGPDAEDRIKAEKGDRSIIASIKSHGEGRDGLQFLFSKQLFANPPGSGKKTEQVLARLQRVGQVEDEVDTWFPRYTPEFRRAIDKAVRQAKYTASTWGSDQRLLNANCDFELSNTFDDWGDSDQ